MAVELATAYVSIVASARGIGDSIAGELGGPIEKAATDSGDKASAGFGDKFKAGIAIVGAAAGAALAAGVMSAVETSAVSDKFAAQLGGSPEYAAEMGKIAGDLYANAYGGSLEEVNTALKNVLQSGAVMEDASNKEIEGITAKVLDLATAFDQDLGKVTTSIGTMMRTGMAADADEALDIITRGMQQGANTSDDLLDTFNEYPALFQRLGLDGQTAMGLIEQGMGAGARNADLVADSLKEFQIRATDASKASSDAYALLGIDATAMTAQIARGGDDASAGLGTVLEKLRGMEDPVLRNMAAVGLFGTQAEDLGEALYALDPTKAVASLGDVAGSAEEMGNTLNDNAKVSFETFRRQAMMKLTDFITDKGIPAMQGLVKWFKDTPGAITAAKVALAALGAAAVLHFTVIAAQAIIASGAAAIAAGAMVIGWVSAAASALVSAAGIALAWVIALGPVALVIAAVIGLVALIATNFDTIKEAIGKAWQWVKNTTSELWEKITGFISAGIDFIKDLFFKFHPLGIFIKHWDAILGFVKELPGKIAGAAKGMWDGITDAFKGAVNWIIHKWNDLRLVIGGQNIDLPFGMGFKIPKVTLDTPNIPTLHAGGVYRAPTVGGEGLALLRDGERVLPPGAPAGGAGPVAINVHGSTDVNALAEQVARTLEWRRLTTAGR